ncbi:MAG: hypothetical protein VB138_13245 [Burkholderia sp.]
MTNESYQAVIDREVTDAVYGALRASDDVLTEFTSETLTGHLCGMLSRFRRGLDVAMTDANATQKVAETVSEIVSETVRVNGEAISDATSKGVVA